MDPYSNPGVVISDYSYSQYIDKKRFRMSTAY